MSDAHKRGPGRPKGSKSKKGGVRPVRKDKPVKVVEEEVVVPELPEDPGMDIKEFGENGEPLHCKSCGSMNLEYRNDEPFPSIVIVECGRCGQNWRHVRWT